MNAAVWLGAAVFTVFAAGSATSLEMRDLLGPKNLPYFSIAIWHIILTRYFALYLICNAVALLHIAGEWLYLGKYPHRIWVTLILSLALVGIVQTFWLQPRLSAWHRLRFSGQSQSQLAADRAFQYGNTTSRVLDLVVIGALAAYVWRLAHQENVARFVGAPKFRS